MLEICGKDFRICLQMILTQDLHIYYDDDDNDDDDDDDDRNLNFLNYQWNKHSFCAFRPYEYFGLALKAEFHINNINNIALQFADGNGNPIEFQNIKEINLNVTIRINCLQGIEYSENGTGYFINQILSVTLCYKLETDGNVYLRNCVYKRSPNVCVNQAIGPIFTTFNFQTNREAQID